MLIFADVVLVTPLQKVCLFFTHMDPHNIGMYILIARVLVFIVPLAVTWASYIGIDLRMINGKAKV